jgi:hypothetical protein
MDFITLLSYPDKKEKAETYNHERFHLGRNMNGRTPYQSFKDGIVKSETEKRYMENAA